MNAVGWVGETPSLIAVLCIAGSTAALTAGILAVLLWTGWAWRLATDIPNHRSLHTLPVPRVGGLGLLPPTLCMCVVLASPFRLLAALAFLLAVISQIDDRRGLSARVRFLAHSGCAGILVVAGWIASDPSRQMSLALPVLKGFHLISPLAAIALGLFVVVALIWAVNLFNFMDGMDGLAGGMAGFGFGAYAFAAVLSMHNGLAPVSAEWLAGASGSGLARLAMSHQIWLSTVCLAGSAVGFLAWNLPPARLFLGDIGSVTLGFLAAALGALGWAAGLWPFEFPVIVFLPFAMDATVTLIKRLLRNERFWEAHREHYYQRMVRMGWSRGRVLGVYYGLMCLVAVIAQWNVSAFLAAQPSGRWLALGVGVLLIGSIGIIVDRQWRLHVNVEANKVEASGSN